MICEDEKGSTCLKAMGDMSDGNSTPQSSVDAIFIKRWGGR